VVFERGGPEIQVNKITNFLVFYKELGLNGYDAGKSITQAI
jgi:hypothetical protein